MDQVVRGALGSGALKRQCVTVDSRGTLCVTGIIFLILDKRPLYCRMLHHRTTS